MQCNLLLMNLCIVNLYVFLPHNICLRSLYFYLYVTIAACSHPQKVFGCSDTSAACCGHGLFYKAAWSDHCLNMRTALSEWDIIHRNGLAFSSHWNKFNSVAILFIIRMPVDSDWSKSGLTFLWQPLPPVRCVLCLMSTPLPLKKRLKMICQSNVRSFTFIETSDLSLWLE